MRVQTLADFDIEDLVPLEHAKNSQVPAIFLHARQDTFVSPQHSRQLYEAYAGSKELVTVDGDHNSERSQQVINHAVGFFKRSFRLGEVDLTIPRHIVDEHCAVPQSPPLRMPSVQPSPQLPIAQTQAQHLTTGNPAPIVPSRMPPQAPGRLTAANCKFVNGYPSPAPPRNTYRALGGA